jgi:tRNA U34 5-carboxymethylaminomethyl modifying GTPase MnmE/TrmE
MGQDTIFAVASGTGRAAIAVLRLSGPVTRLAVESVAGLLPEPRFAALANCAKMKHLHRPTSLILMLRRRRRRRFEARAGQ